MSKSQARQRQARLMKKAEAGVDDPIYSSDLRLAALAADAMYDPEKKKELDERLSE